MIFGCKDKRDQKDRRIRRGKKLSHERFRGERKNGGFCSFRV